MSLLQTSPRRRVMLLSYLVPNMLDVLPDVCVTCFYEMLSAMHVHRYVFWRHTPGRLNAKFKCKLFLWNALTTVSLAPCYWPFLCHIPISHNVHGFVSGAGRLPSRLTWILLNHVRTAWADLMVRPYQCFSTLGHFVLGEWYDRARHIAYTSPTLSARRIVRPRILI